MPREKILTPADLLMQSHLESDSYNRIRARLEADTQAWLGTLVQEEERNKIIGDLYDRGRIGDFPGDDQFLQDLDFEPNRQTLTKKAKDRLEYVEQFNQWESQKPWFFESWIDPAQTQEWEATRPPSFPDYRQQLQEKRKQDFQGLLGDKIRPKPAQNLLPPGSPDLTASQSFQEDETPTTPTLPGLEPAPSLLKSEGMKRRAGVDTNGEFSADTPAIETPHSLREQGSLTDFTQSNIVDQLYAPPSALPDDLQADIQAIPIEILNTSKASLNSIVRGYIGTSASAIKDIGILAKQFDLFGELEGKTAAETGSYQLGQTLQQFADKHFPADPERRESFLQDVMQGLGSMAAFIGPALFTQAITRGFMTLVAQKATSLATSASFGSLANATELYERALQDGQSEEVALQAAGWGNIFGLSEAAPIAGLFTKMDKATNGKLKAALFQAFATGTEEALQEAGQAFAGNATVKALYKENQDLFEGVFRGGEVGGAVGGITGFLFGLFRPRMRAGQTPPPLVEEGGFTTLPDTFIPEVAAVTTPIITPPEVQGVPTQPTGEVTPEGVEVFTLPQIEAGVPPPPSAPPPSTPLPPPFQQHVTPAGAVPGPLRREQIEPTNLPPFQQVQPIEQEAQRYANLIPNELPINVPPTPGIPPVDVAQQPEIPNETLVLEVPEAARPRSELPDEENALILNRARKAQADMEIAGDERGGMQFDYAIGPGVGEKTTFSSATSQWYKKLTTFTEDEKRAKKKGQETGRTLLSKQSIINALRKIVQDEGKDVGKNVQAVKEAILSDPEFEQSEFYPRTPEDMDLMIAEVQAEQVPQETALPYAKEQPSPSKATIPKSNIDKLLEGSGRLPWEMTKGAFVGKATDKDEVAIALAAHATHVREAVQEGKPVPDIVLEGYKNNNWAKRALGKMEELDEKTGADSQALIRL